MRERPGRAKHPDTGASESRADTPSRNKKKKKKAEQLSDMRVAALTSMFEVLNAEGVLDVDDFMILSEALTSVPLEKARAMCVRVNARVLIQRCACQSRKASPPPSLTRYCCHA